MRKTILTLFIIGMFIGVANVSMAIIPDQPSKSVQYYTEFTGDGIISVDQVGHNNVCFENRIRIGYGTLNFDQDIVTDYGQFENDIRLNGHDLKLDNIACEADDVIEFNQKLFAGESARNGDQVRSRQIFTKNCKFLAQEVIAHPTDNPNNECEPDRLNMFSGEKGQFGMMSKGPNATAVLGQKGKFIGDYFCAEQRSNIGGFSKSTIESYNNADWINFEQMMMFS